jgi:hypothetical protein
LEAKIEIPLGTSPTPAVVMNNLSAQPRFSTFVSPVTIATPALAAAWDVAGRYHRRGKIAA